MPVNALERAAPQYFTEQDYVQNLPPTEALRLRIELANKHKFSPKQAKANRRKTAKDIAYITPVLANFLSARDVVRYLNKAGQTTGRNPSKTRRNVALAGLSALGAVTGLPFGRTASQVAKTAPLTMRSLPGAPTAKAKKLSRGSFELEYYGQQVKVLQNPSPVQLKGFLNRTQYKAARRIVDPDTGDVYVWDAGDPALHALVAERIGVDAGRMKADVLAID